MTRLEGLTPSALVRDRVPGGPVSVVAERWAVSASTVVTHRTAIGDFAASSRSTRQAQRLSHAELSRRAET